jgi:hypothetical protein
MAATRDGLFRLAGAPDRVTLIPWDNQSFFGTHLARGARGIVACSLRCTMVHYACVVSLVVALRWRGRIRWPPNRLKGGVVWTTH